MQPHPMATSKDLYELTKRLAAMSQAEEITPPPYYVYRTEDGCFLAFVLPLEDTGSLDFIGMTDPD